jgi:hypothetical protein
MFAKLEKYCQAQGDCLVPRSYKKDPLLGRSVSMQWSRWDKLDSERISRLESIGFVWIPFDQQALGRDVCQAQRILLTTRAQPSSTILQKGSVSWNSYGVMTQRKQCDKLNPTHRERLDSIGFVWQPKHGSCVASKISVTVIATLLLFHCSSALTT